MTVLYNIESIISSFKNYLREVTLKRFSSYECDTFIYGFEGNHHYFTSDSSVKFFHRFIFDIQNDKYSLFYVKTFDSVQPIIENVSLYEVIQHYNQHNNSIFNQENSPVSYER